jgi:hypothetical protein
MSRLTVALSVVLLLALGAVAAHVWPGAGPLPAAAAPLPATAAPPGPVDAALAPAVPLAVAMPDAPQITCSGCLRKVYGPMRFLPMRSELTYVMMGGALEATALATGWGFTTPLDLPNGATVQQVTFYYVDNSSTADMVFTVYKYDTNNLGWGYTSIAAGASSGASTSVNVLTLSTPFVIDSGQNDYELYVEPYATGNAQRFWGAVVWYTVPAAYLPALSR